MRPTDFHDDHGAALAQLLGESLGQYEDLLKTASFREREELSDRDFAVILVDGDGSRHGKFACYDAGTSFASLHYLSESLRYLNPAAAKVASASLMQIAADLGIPDELVPVAVKEAASMELDPRERQLINDTREVVYYPPVHVEAVKEASLSVFDQVKEASAAWDDLEPWQRREVAQELSAYAGSTPVDIPHKIASYAGNALGDQFDAHMRTRVQYAPCEESSQAYSMLKEGAALMDPDSVVETLYRLDTAAGHRWNTGDRYGESFADPFRVVFENVKSAELYSWSDGADFTNELELRSFVTAPGGRDIFTCTFQDDLWFKFQKDPVGYFKAASGEHKRLISRMARQYGIKT